jgi:monooxygenase
VGESAVAPFVENFSSGYIQRALASWPKQGRKKPWRVYQNYFRDTISLKWTRVDDEGLEFSTLLAQVPQKSVKPTEETQVAIGS